jgi:hypothetical protein
MRGSIPLGNLDEKNLHDGMAVCPMSSLQYENSIKL